MPQATFRGVLMRGGTSRGIFCDLEDLPPAGRQRDALILEVLGSPDPNQIDGLGGGISSTSKLMAVTTSQRAGIDIDYLFAQAAVREEVVDYRGNCGNLTAAIGAYAIDEGMVTPVEPTTIVELYNLNTGVHVQALVPVVGGRAAVQGDHRIAGVPRPGARVVNTYFEPAGAQFGALYPTGRPRDVLRVGEQRHEFSLIDVGNPVLFLRATDLGLDGSELPDAANSDPGLLDRLELIRGHAAMELGRVERPEDAVRLSASLPMISIVAERRSYTSATGEFVTAAETDLCARAVTLQRFHHAYPITVLMCTAAAARLPGTVVEELAHVGDPHVVRIGHAKGMTSAELDIDLDRGDPLVRSVAVTRTVRRLMAGEIYHRSPLRS